MQINKTTSQPSFQSKSSIKKMLLLPATSQTAKDINKLTSTLVDELYSKRKFMPEHVIVVKNKTELTAMQKEMGDRLLITPNVEKEIKNQAFKIPFFDVLKFLDILSENPKTPIRSLIGKMNNFPTIKKGLDLIKRLDVSHPAISRTNIYRIKSGGEEYNQAMLIPLRSTLESTDNSIEEIITPIKNKIAQKCQESPSTLVSLKDNLYKLTEYLKTAKCDKKLNGVTQFIQFLIEKLVKEGS